MSEILLHKAKLADKKKQLDSLEMKMQNHIIIIREALDPYEENFENLEVDRAAVAMNDLKELWSKSCELQKQIKKMERELNV